MYNVSFKRDEGNRFHLVVPKTVNNKATVRNLIKRRARHILRLHKNEIEVGAGGKFFFKKGAEKLKFKELEGEITRCLK